MEDSRTTHGGRALYTCHENYTLIGHEKRTCAGEGKWSGEAPKCLFDWCPEPPQIHGGVIEVSGRRTGSTATYSCKNGFILFGQSVCVFVLFFFMFLLIVFLGVIMRSWRRVVW